MVPDDGDILFNSSVGVDLGAVAASDDDGIVVEFGGDIVPGAADASGAGEDIVCAVACEAAKSAALANMKSRIFDVWE